MIVLCLLPVTHMYAAYLIETDLSLQELTADSDHLVSSVVQSLGSPPDPEDDLVLETQLREFEVFSGSALLLLSSLASNKEEIRCRISSQACMMKSLAKALSSPNMALKLPALRYTTPWPSSDFSLGEAASNRMCVCEGGAYVSLWGCDVMRKLGEMAAPLPHHVLGL